MEVVSLRASQLTQQIYSSSVRLLVSSQQQHILAFCTLLTVALSVLLLSRRGSHLYYPINFTKCLTCLRYVRPSTTRLRLTLSSTPYLKLKRLRNLTANYVGKMRKATKLRVKNIINIKSGMASGYGSWVSSSTSASSVSSSSFPRHSASQPQLYCPACDNSNVSSAVIPPCQSYPTFEPAAAGSETTSMRRNFTEPRINSSKVHLYRKLPLRSMSRAWGEINSIELPTWCRKPCFYFYSWMFSCNLEEIDIDDLTHYKNLSEFFRRGLKPDARIIHPDILVSPCDGKILHFGQVEKGMLEQVKGVNYSLQAFLGEQNWPKNTPKGKKRTSSVSSSMSSSSSSSGPTPVYTISSDEEDSASISYEERLEQQQQRRVTITPVEANDELYEKSILYNPDENCLYHCVIYLAPGDYHRFHSPADWRVYSRRHFPGELFSVNPSVARWLQGLFNFNERVVYYGEWEHGFFSMTAVGATNVGSIRVYMDDGLTTNTKLNDLSKSDLEKNFSRYEPSVDSLRGIELKKGENFGEFNLGSTIVLIFEAPKDFKFTVNQNEKVFFGCQLGSSPVESTHL